MPIPLRILRTHVDDLPGARPHFSSKELDRQDRILDTACALMARYGRANLTFTSLAVAMRLAPATIRRLFPDLDSILFELIIRHLRALNGAMAKIPFDHPNRQAARRAAYVEFSRNGFSGTTAPHTLLIRERHTLPPDLLDQIEHLRDRMGDGLARDHGEIVLCLLDNPFLQTPQIEAMLAALEPPEAALAPPIILPKHGRPRSHKRLKPTYQKTPRPQARAGPTN